MWKRGYHERKTEERGEGAWKRSRHWGIGPGIGDTGVMARSWRRRGRVWDERVNQCLKRFHSPEGTCVSTCAETHSTPFGRKTLFLFCTHADTYTHRQALWLNWLKGRASEQHSDWSVITGGGELEIIEFVERFPVSKKKRKTVCQTFRSGRPKVAACSVAILYHNNKVALTLSRYYSKRRILSSAWCERVMGCKPARSCVWNEIMGLRFSIISHTRGLWLKIPLNETCIFSQHMVTLVSRCSDCCGSSSVHILYEWIRFTQHNMYSCCTLLYLFEN